MNSPLTTAMWRVAIVNAALRSIERRGQLVAIADIIAEAQRGEGTRHVA